MGLLFAALGKQQFYDKYFRALNICLISIVQGIIGIRKGGDGIDREVN